MTSHVPMRKAYMICFLLFSLEGHFNSQTFVIEMTKIAVPGLSFFFIDYGVLG